MLKRGIWICFLTVLFGFNVFAESFFDAYIQDFLNGKGNYVLVRKNDVKATYYPRSSISRFALEKNVLIITYLNDDAGYDKLKLKLNEEMVSIDENYNLIIDLSVPKNEPVAVEDVAVDAAAEEVAEEK